MGTNFYQKPVAPITIPEQSWRELVFDEVSSIRFLIVKFESIKITNIVNRIIFCTNKGIKARSQVVYFHGAKRVLNWLQILSRLPKGKPRKREAKPGHGGLALMQDRDIACLHFTH